jgi:hypothetical protein
VRRAHVFRYKLYLSSLVLLSPRLHPTPLHIHHIVALFLVLYEHVNNGELADWSSAVLNGAHRSSRYFQANAGDGILKESATSPSYMAPCFPLIINVVLFDAT